MEMWTVMGALLPKKKSYTSTSTCKQTGAGEPHTDKFKYEVLISIFKINFCL
jgi:hypothetical protein